MGIVGRMRLHCGNGKLPADTAVILCVAVNNFFQTTPLSEVIHFSARNNVYAQ